MRLDDAPESGNVEDRRGMRTAGWAAGGGGIIILILALIFGIDPNQLGLVGKQGPLARPPEVPNTSAPSDGYKQFASKVLGTTEVVWTQLFEKYGYGAYKKPKMVLFSEAVRTNGCGSAPSSVGPFYCPADQTVYLDPTFFDELEKKLGGSKAAFSQAYVIGHEVGHHVQNLRGYSARADAKRRTRQENEYSIRLELQADYLAGVWAHHAEKTFKILERGDTEEAIQTARAIGDNRIQQKARGWVSPEGFNHGTDRQRAAAFIQGLRTGDASQRQLDLFFDEKATPFNARTGELRNHELLGF
ncbi:MAG: neutral zinc metallopeptidase [Gemmataceae bacterium]|nr:neutral zinc metallopeptidase [Gemmata sp.]MDW8199136.1 neutral zinc metallopeptidase [Gemmataceae bacterium]